MSEARPTAGTWLLGGLMLATLALVFVETYLLQPRAVFAVIGLLGAFVIVLAGGLIALRTSGPPGRVRLVDVVTAAAASAATLLLVRGLDIPPLVAAAAVATAIGVAMLGDGPLDPIAGSAGYAGAFVGLVAPTVTIALYWVVLAGALTGLLWGLIATSAFAGCGGRMGTTAFLASILVYQLASFLGEKGDAVLLPPVGGLAHWAVVPTGCLATLVTWLLMYRLGWSLPMASGLTSLLVCGGLAMWGPESVELVLATAWYGGTAVGRTGANRLPNAGWVALAGLAYGGLMLRFEGPLQGHVGIIGATGLMGVLAVVAVRRALQAMAPLLPGKPRVA